MNTSASESSPTSDIDAVNIFTCSMWLTLTAVTVIYLPFLYKRIRCKFPVRVNCWFCNQSTTVPYEDANCWDCPHCEQYNGFNKDGGYNKEIKEQYTSSLNTLTYNSSMQLSNSHKKETTSNGFCRLCNINQQLKIKQLASFVPLNEDNYDEEIEQFKNQLEKSYKLCSQCERCLTNTLKSQHYNLLKDRLNVHKDKSQVLKLNAAQINYNYKLILDKLRGVLCSGLKLISAFISAIVCFSLAFQLEKEAKLLKTTLPDVFELDYVKLLEEYLLCLSFTSDIRRDVISVGLLCCALSSFCRQTRTDHPGLFVLWAVLYAMSWSDLIALQFVVAGICLALYVVETKTSHRYKLKRLLKNETGAVLTDGDTEPSFTDLFCKNSCLLDSKIEEEDSNVNEIEEISHLFSESKTEANGTEVNKKNGSSKLKASPVSTVDTNQKVPVKTSKIFNKNFLSSLESDRAERELSPSPEIFHNLTNLHIGNDRGGASEKRSNFLFENHNFEEKLKKSPPLLRPPKFFKACSYNSWTNGELNETISRSSTPSSGYSSQKADKPETRQAFQFPKTISPVPCGRSTPQDNLDYWDRSQNYFNTGNYHCFAPGCVPFQQFPSPLGHTTVYTYARPSNYPLPFSAAPNSYGYPCSQSLRSAPFSDASETENLFQNASSSVLSTHKWSAIKSLLYNVSIFFNVVTTCVLAYFTWSGIISMTGK